MPAQEGVRILEGVVVGFHAVEIVLHDGQLGTRFFDLGGFAFAQFWVFRIDILQFQFLLSDGFLLLDEVPDELGRGFHQAYTRFQAGFYEDLYVALGGFQACRIAVAQDDHFVGEALEEPGLLFGECGAAGRYAVHHAVVVRGDDVEVPFYQDSKACFLDAPAVFVQAEQDFGFAVEQGVFGVDVLGALLFVGMRGVLFFQATAGQGIDAPHVVGDAEKEPAFEKIVVAMVAFAQYAEFDERGLLPETGLAHQVVVGCPAHAECVGGFAFDEAAIGVDEFLFCLQIAVNTGQCSLISVVPVYGMQHFGHFLPAFFFLFGAVDIFLPALPVVVLHLYFAVRCGFLEGFRVGQVFVLHEEMNGIAAGAATETLEGVGGRKYGE